MSSDDDPIRQKHVRADELIGWEYCTTINFIFQLLAAAFIYQYGYQNPPTGPCISIMGHVIPFAINVYVMVAALAELPRQRWFNRVILILQSLLSALVVVAIVFSVAHYTTYFYHRGLIGA